VIPAEKPFTQTRIRNKEIRLLILRAGIGALLKAEAKVKAGAKIRSHPTFQAAKTSADPERLRIQRQALRHAQGALADLHGCKKALAGGMEHEAEVRWEAMEEKETLARRLSYEAPARLSQRRKREQGNKQRRAALAKAPDQKRAKTTNRNLGIYREYLQLLKQGKTKGEAKEELKRRPLGPGRAGPSQSTLERALREGRKTHASHTRRLARRT